MSNTFLLKAKIRENIGKGASRRLRRENKIPAIIYGGAKEPQSLAISHFDILKCLNDERFYSQIIDIEIDGKVQETILRDLQRHPYKPNILHADFQRIVRGQELVVNIPITYINIETAKGVKAGGILSQNVIDIEITCRPSNIPESIEVDVKDLDINDSLRLSDIKLPENVVMNALDGIDNENDERNISIVSIHPPKAEQISEETGTTEDETDETEKTDENKDSE